ncbi:MAG: hypothetical protein VW600_04805 [Ferrovibrio sp.]
MSSVTARVQNGQLILSLPQDALEPELAAQLLEFFVAAPTQARDACLDVLHSSAARSTTPDKEEALPPPTLSLDEPRYIRMIQQGLNRRDQQAIYFAEADLFALSEAERLGIKLTARQRNTLIQYYVERLPPDDIAQPSGGSSREAALARARLLADRIRIKR